MHTLEEAMMKSNKDIPNRFGMGLGKFFKRILEVNNWLMPENAHFLTNSATDINQQAREH